MPGMFQKENTGNKAHIISHGGREEGHSKGMHIVSGIVVTGDGLSTQVQGRCVHTTLVSIKELDSHPGH